MRAARRAHPRAEHRRDADVVGPDERVGAAHADVAATHPVARTVREACEREGVSWAHWEFDGSGFTLWNRQTGAWEVGLVKALLPDAPV